MKLQSTEESRKRLADLESVVSGQETAMSSISKQLDDVEKRFRRNNTIAGCVIEEGCETQETLLKKVNDYIFENKLGQELNSFDQPVILKLTDFTDKMKFLRNSHKLKNTEISIS